MVTPIALGLISAGGIRIYQLFSMYDYARLDLFEFVGPVLLQFVGLVLLVAVVATGLWSSAGLIAAGALGLVMLLLAIAPVLLLEVFKSAPSFIPRDWIDGVLYGLPLVVYAVLGTMGLTLMMIRRSTRGADAGLRVVGLVAAPVLLAGGGWLLVWGTSEGQMQAVVTFQTSINLMASIAVIAGVVLTVAGIGVSRWSPWALVIPAAVLLLISLLFVVTMSVSEFRGLIPLEVLRVGMPFVVVGGATAVAVAQLTFTAVVVILGRRAHRNAASAPSASFGAHPVGQYPPASPAAYPPAPPTAYPPAAYPPAPPTA